MSEVTDISLMSPDAYIRLPTVLAHVPMSRATLYRMIKRRAFPPPVRLSLHASAWRVSSVREFLADPNGWGQKHAP